MIPMPAELFKSLTLKVPAAAGSYVKGRWQAPTMTETTIQAVVYPADADELLMLPEGERVKAGLEIFSTSPIRTADETSKRPPDVVVYGGQEYEVQKAEDWAGWGQNGHYRAIAARKDVTA